MQLGRVKVERVGLTGVSATYHFQLIGPQQKNKPQPLHCKLEYGPLCGTSADIGAVANCKTLVVQQAAEVKPEGTAMESWMLQFHESFLKDEVRDQKDYAKFSLYLMSQDVQAEVSTRATVFVPLDATHDGSPPDPVDITGYAGELCVRPGQNISLTLNVGHLRKEGVAKEDVVDVCIQMLDTNLVYYSWCLSGLAGAMTSAWKGQAVALPASRGMNPLGRSCVAQFEMQDGTFRRGTLQLSCKKPGGITPAFGY